MVLCHCKTCRHSTGQLCTSYVPIHEPDSVSGATSYSWGSSSTLWFCATCGCHVFRSTIGDADAPEEWEVASGVVLSAAGSGGGPGDVSGAAEFQRQVGVRDTGDGGLSVWLGQISIDKDADDRPAHNFPEWALPAGAAASDQAREQSGGGAARDELQASCHCHGARFHITRPNASSTSPFSGFPDLMIPYTSKDPQIKNPDDVKWWLRQDSKKYLAGLCACKSCRLVSGFEIQPWTFVPEANIIFHVGPPGPARTVEAEQEVGLDFDALHGAGILQAYESSPGVIREFCPRCGANVFWHDKWRPQLIDTSVGLLCAGDGARAESWLDWWRERVSFEEDAALDRHGAAARWATVLVSALEENLRRGAGQ